MKRITIFILSIILMNSCIKKEDEAIPVGCAGPNFSYKTPFTVSSRTVDFRLIEKGEITASFTQPIDWKIQLEGKTSHAKKEYSGHTDTIGILWDGAYDKSIPFAATEDVKVTLSIPCNSPVEKTIHIDNERDLLSLGTLITDFEGHGSITNNVYLNGYCNKCWSSYYSAPNLISKLQITSTPLNAPNGSNYLTIQGQAGSNSFFAGGTYIDLPDLSAYTANNTYFNAMINSGNKPNTTLSLTISTNTGKRYAYMLPLSWSGWQLVSIKCSDFKSATEESLTTMPGSSYIDFGLNCVSLRGQEVEMNIDLIMFTKDSPL